MVWEDLTPDKIITDAAVQIAAIVAMATGCSTNAVVHLIAMARRAGVNLMLDDLDALDRTTRLIVSDQRAKTTLWRISFTQAVCAR